MKESKELLALQKIREGEMEDAHHIVQELDTKAACWIHALIHKEEGDIGNSRYWYNRAGMKFIDLSLADEIKRIETALTMP